VGREDGRWIWWALEERVGRLKEGGGRGGVVWSVVAAAHGHWGARPVLSARRGDAFALRPVKVNKNSTPIRFRSVGNSTLSACVGGVFELSFYI
jgi:hypothetical protein